MRALANEFSKIGNAQSWPVEHTFAAAAASAAARIVSVASWKTLYYAKW